jgi:hypothetical protein
LHFLQIQLKLQIRITLTQLVTIGSASQNKAFFIFGPTFVTTQPAVGAAELLTLCFGCMTTTELLLRPTMIRIPNTLVATLWLQQFAFWFQLEIIEFALAFVAETQQLIGSMEITIICIAILMLSWPQEHLQQPGHQHQSRHQLPRLPPSQLLSQPLNQRQSPLQNLPLSQRQNQLKPPK